MKFNVQVEIDSRWYTILTTRRYSTASDAMHRFIIDDNSCAVRQRYRILETV